MNERETEQENHVSHNREGCFDGRRHNLALRNGWGHGGGIDGN
jgi:hypothetical protein